jgi:hypothetical protein
MAKKNQRNQKVSKNQQNAIDRIRGQGGYYTEKVVPFMRNVIPDGSFERLGGRFGGAAAAALSGVPALHRPGEALGQNLGRKIAKIAGFGDYSVRMNTLSTVGKAINPGESVPEFGTNGNATRVRHREYIGDIAVPASPLPFNNTTYTINPGDFTTFPWLASVAAQYQQYRFNGLIFEFKTLTSEYSATGPLGSVMLATNYDVLELPFTDKIRLENSQYAVSAKPSCSQIHTVECDPSQTAAKLLYIRDSSSSTTVSQDARWQDLGKFQLATAGLSGSSGQVLGELWASYDVTLYKPEVAQSAPLSQKIVAGGTITKTTYLGTAPVSTGSAIVSPTNNSLVFNIPGEYMVACSASVTGGAAIGGFTYSVANVSTMAFNVASSDLEYILRVQVTAPGQYLVIDYTTSTTLIGFIARISKYQYSLA